MSNNNTRGNSQQPVRSPKFVWVTRPSFTTGESRVYFSKEDAIKDFGQPADIWVETEEDVLEIGTSPDWDNDFDISWRLEKLEVRSLTKPPAPVVTTPKAVIPTPALVETPSK